MNTADLFSQGISAYVDAYTKLESDDLLAEKSNKVRIFHKLPEEMINIDLFDDQMVIVDGPMIDMIILSATGIGAVAFVAGIAATIALPPGTGWNGNFVPTISEGKFYIMTYALGTFYLDEGRGGD